MAYGLSCVDEVVYEDADAVCHVAYEDHAGALAVRDLRRSAFLVRWMLGGNATDILGEGL